MVNITLSVPKNLKELMNEFPETNWSAVARKAISKEVLKRTIAMKILDRLTQKSELTDKDCIRLGEKLKDGRFDLLKKQGLI